MIWEGEIFSYLWSYLTGVMKYSGSTFPRESGNNWVPD